MLHVQQNSADFMVLRRFCEFQVHILDMASAHRTYKEECSFIERQDENSFLIKKGFVPNMKVTLT